MNIYAQALVVLAVAAASFTAGYMGRGSAETGRAAAVAAASTEAAQKAAALTAEAAKAQYAALFASLEEREAVRAEVIETTNTIVKEIQLAPVTTECADSPAVRVALDGLRQQAGSASN